MLKPLLGLLLGSLAAYGVAVLAAPSAARVAGYGLAITLFPALLSCGLVIAVCERHPEAGPAAAMAATGLRMGGAAVAVSVLGTVVEKVGIPFRSRAEWTVGFYLVTLALETAVLWGRLARAGPPEGPPA